MKRRSLLGLAGIAGTALLLAATTPAPAPIAEAAMRGDVESVMKLLKTGASVNAAQGDGMTALHWAAERGDLKMATALIAAHPNVKAVTRIGGYTPLHIAARAGSADVLVALIKAGSDVKATTTSGATALHFAAKAGNTKAITALLDAGADANARESQWGQTPLVFAAEYDRADAIRVLMKHGADASLHTNIESVTEDAAKEQASTKRRNEVLLAFEGAPPAPDSAALAKISAEKGPAAAAAAAKRVPKGPFTAAQMQVAIDSGRAAMARMDKPKGPVAEVVDTLNGGISGYLTSVVGVGGLSALHHAVRQGNVDAVVALIDGGANVNDISGVDHSTPLLLAAINGQFDAAMKLIEKKADPNIASTAGMTPLYAVINTQWAPKSRYPQPQALQNQKTPYLQVMDALLKAGANPNVRLTEHPWYFAFNNCGNANCGLENLEGTTAFWRAAYAVDVDAMRLLVKHGADVNIPSQRTPASLAAASRGRGGRGRAGGADGFGPPPMQNLPGVDSLAKIAPVGLGVYAIHAAAGVGYGNGFAGNSHRHAPDGWMPAMRYLVEELHMDVNARDQQGMTPLHHAAARGDNDMIKYLVAHGADVKAVSKKGQTVVDMANGPVQRVSPLPETIALLEKLGAVNQHHCVSC
jgi:ankyrin repeat protein